MDNPARWAEDPTGVFTHRFWDGGAWTDRVAIDGREARSPLDAPREEAEGVAARLRPAQPPPGAAQPPPPPPPPAPVPPAPTPSWPAAADGQTPAKKLLGMQVVDTRSGRPLDWATYVLWRGGLGFIGGLILGTIVIGVFVYLMPLFNDRHQHFYEIMSKSAVVDVQ